MKSGKLPVKGRKKITQMREQYIILVSHDLF